MTNRTKTIYAAPSFKVPLGEGYFKDSGCPVDKCAFVNDLEKADAVIFKDAVYASRKNVSPKQVDLVFLLYEIT